MAWMRHKPEDETGSPTATAPQSPAQQPAASPSTPAARTQPVASSGRTVNIGPSVHIKGTLSGQEDLTVDGKVEGKITLKEHVLTIGANGQIDAELQAKAVIVHGKVAGNITADNRVEVASSGTVYGDIRAPRVAIADGAKFKGSIDMDVAGGAREVKARPEGQTPKAVPQEHAKAAS
jgi:cytoskeletal protein CcmA (bactofilin family)